MARTKPNPSGRRIGFTEERRELFLKAYTQGLPTQSCCTAAGGIEVVTYLDWVKIGEGREAPNREVSQTKRDAAVMFVQRLRAVDDLREAALLERCTKTLDEAASQGFVKVKIRKTTRYDAKGNVVHSETTEDIEKATPIWQAAAYIKERREHERWGRRDKVQAEVTQRDFTDDDLTAVRSAATADEATILKGGGPDAVALAHEILRRARFGSSETT